MKKEKMDSAEMFLLCVTLLGAVVIMGLIIDTIIRFGM